ncbi:MAG: hypothetical protein Hals2KO_37100 [Halioglobus sp.]|jgi:hypothetical protein
MNTIRVITAIAFISLSTGSIAAVEGDSEIDKVKQAAVERCISAAQERYGAAQEPSKPKKGSIGPKKGYKMTMRVGEKRKKTVVCHALNDGDVRFFTKH